MYLTVVLIGNVLITGKVVDVFAQNSYSKGMKIGKYTLDITLKPGFNEPLCNEDLDITKNILQISYSKIYEKEPRYNLQSLLKQTFFATPLALCPIKL